MLVTLLLLCAAVAPGAGGTQAARPLAVAEERVRVEIVGRLATGLVALGGETTGLAVSAKGLSWELDVGRDQDLRKKADGLSGEVVVVTGTLEPRAGVELRRQRLIVRVTSLERAPGQN
jgi:hypothetical protein